jgi:hypothetical protein
MFLCEILKFVKKYRNIPAGPKFSSKFTRRPKITHLAVDKILSLPYSRPMAFSLEQRLGVTREFLKILQSSVVSITQIEGLVNLFEVPAEDLEARIFLLSRLAELAREISLKTYRSDEVRDYVINSIQGLLDRYIEEEDAMIEEVQD